MKWKKIRKWLLILAILYIAGGFVIYFLQDAVLFHPVSLKRDHKYEFKEPHEDITIDISEKESLNLVRFNSTDSVTRGVVLYFHGNKKNISRYAPLTPYFTRDGYEVIIIDYPGFGKSTGKFTEQTLYDWSLQVYKLARSRFPPDSIIIYGKSMGTGIAAQLATKVKCRRLILETPYYDLPSVLKHYLFIYPIDWMIHYKLPIYKYLPLVEMPVTIFHGTSDGVITYGNAKRLVPLLKKEDEFITIKGGSHNDLYEFPLTVQKLDSLLGL
jgi:alpha-beta hydrolase superfamily lysophospholipase